MTGALIAWQLVETQNHRCSWAMGQNRSKGYLLPLLGRSRPRYYSQFKVLNKSFTRMQVLSHMILCVACLGRGWSQICKHFGLDWKVPRIQQDRSANRIMLFQQQKLHESLVARFPPWSDDFSLFVVPCRRWPRTGMLMMKIKDMRNGVFKGMTALTRKDGKGKHHIHLCNHIHLHLFMVFMGFAALLLAWLAFVS